MRCVCTTTRTQEMRHLTHPQQALLENFFACLVGEEEAALAAQLPRHLVEIFPVLVLGAPTQRHHHHLVLPQEKSEEKNSKSEMSRISMQHSKSLWEVLDVFEFCGSSLLVFSQIKTICASPAVVPVESDVLEQTVAHVVNCECEYPRVLVDCVPNLQFHTEKKIFVENHLRRTAAK